MFFFSSRRRHTRFDCDWSSDVCSSDLPETSERLPWAQESLTVRTAAVSASGIEEDIFFLRSAAALVTLGFVEHAQAFHEQALSIQCGGLLRSFAFEVDLKISRGPA